MVCLLHCKISQTLVNTVSKFFIIFLVVIYHSVFARVYFSPGSDTPPLHLCDGRYGTHLCVMYSISTFSLFRTLFIMCLIFIRIFSPLMFLALDQIVHVCTSAMAGLGVKSRSLMRYVFYILILTLSMTCKLCMQVYPNPFSHVILRICKIVHARAHSKGRRGHITHPPPPRRPYPAYSTHGENLFLSFTILNINDAGTCYLGDD